MGRKEDADDLDVVASTLYLDHLAATLISNLADAGVRAILLKGASFRDLLFDRDEPRPYSDIDLLISPGQSSEAGRALERLGYADIFAGAAQTETSPFATEFRGARAIVDLHRSLPGITVPEAEAWAVLSAQVDHLVLEGVGVEVLDRPARCLHVALNAASDGWSRSKEDLQRAMSRLPAETWGQAVALAERLGALPSLAAALMLVPEGDALRQSLGIDVHVPLGVALRSQAPPPLSLGLHRLVTTPGLRGKAAFFGRRLVPTPSGLRYWSPLARRGRLGMALAYAWRPFHLLLHTPGAVVALARAWRTARAERRH